MRDRRWTGLLPGAAYRRDVLGWDDATARAEMEAIWHPEGVWADFIRG